jgi:antitoxin VapB
MLVAPHGDRRPRAKVFWTGRSQAIRLPKEFRFNVDAVFIHREGNKVILEPDGGWPEGYFEWLMTGPMKDLDFELPSRTGPARSKDPFQVPVGDGSGRTMNVFELLDRRDRKAKRKRKRKR